MLHSEQKKRGEKKEGKNLKYRLATKPFNGTIRQN